MCNTNNKRTIELKCFKSNGHFNGRTNSDNWWKQNNLEYLYDDIIAYTSFLSNCSMGLRVYHYLNDIPSIPICKSLTCDNKTKYHANVKQYATYCSTKCSSLDTLEKRQITSLMRYGVDNPAKSSTVKSKSVSTNLDRYGVTNYAYTHEFKESMYNYHNTLSTKEQKDIKNKRANTCRDRYGVDSPLQSSSVKQKIKKTMNARYGVDSPLQSPAIMQKFNNTMNARYGKKSIQQIHLDDNFINNIKNKDWVITELKTKSLRELSVDNNISYSHLCKLVSNTGINLHNYSSFETEVYNYIKSLTNKTILRNVKILNNKEVDIYIPGLNLGIECNGVYWHSEVSGKKNKQYHNNKLVKATALGIHLIHLFDNEWYNIQNIVKSQIAKYFDTNIPIYARKCVLQLVNISDERNFLNTNHLQQYSTSKVCIGLYYNNELVQLMSFGKPRFSKKYEWEIIRLVSKIGTTIIGGTSKLYKYFTRTYKPLSVVSYSDRRWFSNSIIYKLLKFKKIHSSSPNYFYTKNYTVLETRNKYQKHKLKKILTNYNSKLTEWENMQKNGYDRIWDCGNDVWVWLVKT